MKTIRDKIQSVPLSKLVDHPDNPNHMSGSTFAKLVRNIERTGRYEPIVVRPLDRKKNSFQIINGHHRRRALKQLGYDSARAIVWDIDDEQTDIFLATLNRLGGSDVLAKKIALLKRLTEKMNARKLSKLLPQTPGQIKRLTNLRMPKIPARPAAGSFSHPLVFFLNKKQKQIIERALAHACDAEQSKALGQRKLTKAAQKASALTTIAQHFLNTMERGRQNDED